MLIEFKRLTIPFIAKEAELLITLKNRMIVSYKLYVTMNSFYKWRNKTQKSHLLWACNYALIGCFNVLKPDVFNWKELSHPAMERVLPGQWAWRTAGLTESMPLPVHVWWAFLLNFSILHCIRLPPPILVVCAFKIHPLGLVSHLRTVGLMLRM